MTIKIFLVRHGESQSQNGESLDHINPELNWRGIEQAKRLTKPIKKINPDRILISPIKRAWRT